MFFLLKETLNMELVILSIVTIFILFLKLLMSFYYNFTLGTAISEFKEGACLSVTYIYTLLGK